MSEDKTDSAPKDYEDDLALIEQIFHSGTLPDSIPHLNWHLVDDLLRTAVRQYPRAIKRILLAQLSKRSTMRVLHHRIHMSTLVRINKLLYAERWEILAAFSSELAIRISTMEVPPFSSLMVERLFQHHLLQHAKNQPEEGPTPLTKAFVNQLIALSGDESQTFIDHLTATPSDITSSDTGADLLEASLDLSALQSDRDKSPELSSYQSVEWLRHFLKHGYFPADLSATALKSFHRDVLSALRSANFVMRELLSFSFKQQQARLRFVQQFDEDTVHAALDLFFMQLKHEERAEFEEFLVFVSFQTTAPSSEWTWLQLIALAFFAEMDESDDTPYTLIVRTILHMVQESGAEPVMQFIHFGVRGLTDVVSRAVWTEVGRYVSEIVRHKKSETQKDQKADQSVQQILQHLIQKHRYPGDINALDLDRLMAALSKKEEGKLRSWLFGKKEIAKKVKHILTRLSDVGFGILLRIAQSKKSNKQRTFFAFWIEFVPNPFSTDLSADGARALVKHVFWSHVIQSEGVKFQPDKIKESIINSLAEETDLSISAVQKRMVVQIRQMVLKNQPSAVLLESFPELSALSVVRSDNLKKSEQSLLFYLSKGRFSQKGLKSPKQAVAYLDKALTSDTKRLADVLTYASQHLNITQRLLRLLSRKQADILLVELYRREGIKIKRWLKVMDQWTASSVLPIRKRQLRSYLMRFVFSTQAELIHESLLLAHVLEQIGIDLDVPYRTLIDTISKKTSDANLPSSVREAIDHISAKLSRTERFRILDGLEQTVFTTDPGDVLQAIDETLQYYHSTGSWPWWSSDKRFFGPVLIDALKKDQLAIRKMLRKHRHRPEFVRLLLKHIKNRDLEILASEIAGGYRPLIEAFQTVLGSLFHQKLIRVGSIKGLKWIPVLTYFLKRKSFSSEKYVEHGIHTVARIAEVSVERLFRMVEQHLSDDAFLHDPVYLRMRSIVQQLMTQGHIESSKPAKKQKQGQKQLSSRKKDITRKRKKQTAADPYDVRIQKRIDALLHFYRYGTLARRHDVFESFQAMEAFQLQLIKRESKIAELLFQKVLQTDRGVQIFLDFFSRTLWMAVVRLVVPSQRDTFLALWIELDIALVGTVKKYERKRYEALYIRVLLKTVFRTADHSMIILFLLEAFLTEVAKSDQAELITSYVRFKEQIMNERNDVLPLLYTWLPSLDAIFEKHNLSSINEESPALQLDETIFVSNAGLVLISPYLTRYFERLGMLANRAFKDEETALRAAMLLQYVATGISEHPEHLLVLNKVMCGVAIPTPIMSVIELTDEEIDVTESLLNGVKSNWPQMQNSTIENLRGAFLIRDGKLNEMEDKWELIVESKAFDIILEFLPWSFSVIKLPWMDKRIEVTWKTRT